MHLYDFKRQLIQANIHKQALEHLQGFLYALARQNSAVKHRFTLAGNNVFFNAAVNHCWRDGHPDSRLDFLRYHFAFGFHFVKYGFALVWVCLHFREGLKELLVELRHFIHVLPEGWHKLDFSAVTAKRGNHAVYP